MLFYRIKMKKDLIYLNYQAIDALCEITRYRVVPLTPPHQSQTELVELKK
jgi:hypothetical protein